MALTDQEKSIVQQIKEQKGTKEHVIEALSQHRAKQPKEEFKTLSEQARESLEKTPEELLGVDKFEDEKVEGEETLIGKIKERGETIKEVFKGKQELLSPEFKENIKTSIGQIEGGEETLKGLDIIGTVISQIPGTDFIKREIENKIDQQIKQSTVAGESIGVINDIIGAGFNKVLEFTGLDKQLEKLGKTKTGQFIGEKIQEGTEIHEAFEKSAPGLAAQFNAGLELSEVFGLGKGGKLGKETIETGVKKIPTPGIKSQALADKLVDTTLKFTKNQKKKFKSKLFAKGETPAQYLQRKGIIEISKNADDIVDNLEKLAKNSKKAVDNSLQQIPGVFKNSSTDKALNVITKQLDDVPGMEDMFNRARELREKAKRVGLTMTETNEVKRLIDSTNDLVSVTGEFKTGVTKQGLTNLRQDVKKFIEKTADDNNITNIKDLNKDTQLSNALLNDIAGNLEESGRNRIFGLTDILIGGGATVGGDFGLGLGVIAGKKLVESEAFKLALSRRLSKISPSKMKEIKTKIINKEPLTGVDKVLITNAILQAKEDSK